MVLVFWWFVRFSWLVNSVVVVLPFNLGLFVVVCYGLARCAGVVLLFRFGFGCLLTLVFVMLVDGGCFAGVVVFVLWIVL